MWKRTRPPPKKRVDAERERRAERERKAISKRKIRVEPSEQEILHRKRVRHFRAHHAEVLELFMRATLRALASGQAVQDVMYQLEARFGLPDNVLDGNLVNGIAIEVLRTEMSEILIRKSVMSNRAQRELIERVIARTVPNRDGPPVAGSTVSRTPPSRFDTHDLQKMIMRETRKAFPYKTRTIKNEVEA